ncbi:MAG: thermonuclease, partial [Syntrophobacter sp. DG_60]
GLCLGKEVDFDVDDEKRYDIYYRILTVVYIDGINLNAELLNRGYAEVLYVPPSEFNPYEWL